MSKKKGKKRIIILAAVAVIALLLVFGYMRMQAGIAQSQKTTYDIITVQRGTIEVKVKGAGTVEPLSDETVYAAAAGTVVDVLAEDGDVVSEGDVIAAFKSDELKAQRDSLKKQIDEIDASMGAMRSVSGSDYIKSPVEGTVMALYARKGDRVDSVMDKYGAVAVVSPDNMLQVTLTYTEGAAQGDEVKVESETKSAKGEVSGADAIAGTITVQFGKKNFKAGETVTVTSKEGVSLGEAKVAIASPVYITARGGVVEKVYEKAGSKVNRWGNIFRLDGEILSSSLYSKIDERADIEDDLEDVEEKLASLTVKAPADGVISGLDLNRDQTVQAGAKLFSLKSNEQVKIDVEIDELDIADIELGQQASVKFDALPDKEYSAAVARINPIGVSQNNVTHYIVTLELSAAQGVMLGMSADVEIASQVAENALYIPIEAIQIIEGERYVVLEQDIEKDLNYTPATNKVKTGITDGVSIEILEGLAEGDRVAVPQVKELSMQEQQMRMWGNMRNGGERSGGSGAPNPAPPASE